VARQPGNPATLQPDTRRLFVKLSVIIPVYNERETVKPAVEAVLAVEKADEIVIIDDGSTDGTRDLYPEIQALSDRIHIHLHEKNQGKGAAVRTGFEKATGDIYLIQDADLEYDPRDYEALVRPIIEKRATVVYGSRFRGGPTKTMFFWHMVGNKFLTLVTNIMYNTILSDMETCYKVFRADVIADIPLRSRGFEFEPEITSKVLKRGHRIYEVAISYNGREFDEGKKLNPWIEGPKALYYLVKYRFVD
jgi:glycosyltransferase involved in cell wall biosynthesis